MKLLLEFSGTTIFRHPGLNLIVQFSSMIASIRNGGGQTFGQIRETSFTNFTLMSFSLSFRNSPMA